MAEQLKLIYNHSFFDAFISAIQKAMPEIESKAFLPLIFTEEWDNLELKQRMRHISKVLHHFLDPDFKKGILQLLEIYKHSKSLKMGTLGFEYMFFPDYIEVYGLDYFNESMLAMEEITQLTSCEFAIRPFFITYPEATLKQMLLWSKHKHPMVRRLATEGCRPRLPWAMALPDFKKNPDPILPILKRLRNDESESVRRSVANNLNDISKDNPDIVYNLVSQWKGESVEVDWVIKHACRTLLKLGLPHIMTLFEYGSVDDLEIGNITVHTPEVKIGDSLSFDFRLKNKTNLPIKVRVEYGIYFQKANGSLSRKVFKISEKDYGANEAVLITRKQSFKVISTRKLHIGDHGVCAIVNGNEFEMVPFQLK